jgi:predicted HD phosphohydrolase
VSDIVVAPATFRAMTESTPDDWEKISAAGYVYRRELPGRVLGQLKSLSGNSGGFPVDRLEHSLQSASLAFRDGMDEEYVVCALLHDIGDVLCTSGHAELAAAMLAPFVSHENHWLLLRHDIFQGYYFFQHIGFDRNAREQFRGHPCFELAANFAARHDQNAFNPHYDTMPLEAFVPMVHRLMLRPPKRPRFMRDYDLRTRKAEV